MQELKPVTVLITAAGNVFMPGTTDCLKAVTERKIRLVGADMNEDPTTLEMFDICYQVPRGDDPHYVDAILDICRKEKVDVVLPIMSVELNALSARKAEFAAEGIHVSVSALEPLRIANNKTLLFDYMTEQGIPCAEYVSVRTGEELRQAVYAMGYPEKTVCIKASEGSGSRGFRILDAGKSQYDILFHEKPNSAYTTLEALLAVLTEKDTMPELMVMEFLPGTEYTVDLLADSGKVLYAGCRRGLNVQSSIMLDGVVDDRPDILALCEQVVNALGLDGNIGFDIKLRADGTPVIMECNPRITAGIGCFVPAGLNLPYLCVKKLLGEALPEVTIRYGTTMRRRWQEMYC